jgi:hypothetical protein
MPVGVGQMRTDCGREIANLSQPGHGAQVHKVCENEAARAADAARDESWELLFSEKSKSEAFG